jgi:putative oxidoreductase
MINAAVAVGRVLLAVVFIVSGATKFGDLAATAKQIAGKGLPMPMVLAGTAAAVELIGGLLVALGWYTRLAALALLVFTAVAGVLFHDFWNVAAAQRASQMAHFLKNLAIIGGLLIVAAVGPGRWSIDGGRR